MIIKITKEDIKTKEEYLIKMLGSVNKPFNKKDIKKTILLKRLKENIKNCKKGDIIYKFDNYKNVVENFKEYVVFNIGNNKTFLFGREDIIINKDGGYIAGGLNGKAVLKEDWLQYEKEVLK